MNRKLEILFFPIAGWKRQKENAGGEYTCLSFHNSKNKIPY